MRKVIKIDPDVHQIARTYVETQLATMKAYGSEVILAPYEYYQLIEDCAEPIQVVKNFRKKDSPVQPDVKKE